MQKNNKKDAEEQKKTYDTVFDIFATFVVGKSK